MASLAGTLFGGGCNELLGISRHALSTDGSAEHEPSPTDAAPDAGGPDAANDRPDPCAAPAVGTEVVTLGRPTWKFLSWAVTVDPLGYSNMSFTSVWKPNHVFDGAYGLFKSKIPHAGPYEGELAAGLKSASLANTGCIDTKKLITVSEVLFSAVLVPSPTAPVAISFDAPGGGPAIRGGFLVDVEILDGDTLVDHLRLHVPTAQQLYDSEPPFENDEGGYTHVLLNWTSSHLALEPGNYEVRVTVDADDASAESQQSISFTME